VINALASRSEQAFRHVPVGLLALGTCSLAWNQFGSILARDWLPYAIATALLVAGLLLSGQAQAPTPTAIGGLVALLGLAGWDALSLRWSAVPALARDEALVVCFYALAFTVPLLVLRSERDKRSATGLVVAALVALALATFVHLLVTGRPTDYYENGRLTFPISYVNAQAALFLLSFWPSVALAARRGLHPVLRGAAIGGATALLAGWLMTQSKGGLLALVVSAIAFFALSPKRLRAVLPAIIPAAFVAGAYEPLTRPFRERADADFAGAIHTASWAALAVVGLAGALGFVYARADRRIILPPRTKRALTLALAVALGAGVVALPVTFFAAVDRPGHFLEEKWQSFKTLPQHEAGSSHLTSLGSNRYDFWRVEVHDTGQHPVAGIGARGFASSYLQHGRSAETPARGHSLLLDTLSETGVVGFVLLVGGLGLPLVGAARRSRQNGLAAGLAAAGTYGLAHMSVDWIWTFPAVGATLFLLLGIANAGGEERGRSLLPPRAAIPLGVAVIILTVGAYAPPWVSARLTAAAVRNPSDALSDLRWARRLDPLSVEPLTVEASLAGSPRAALRPLRRALAKQPRDASLHYRLGRALLASGRRRDARLELLTAQRLDPRDPIIARALRAAER
jgi:O-antigen ligase/polysaccharide polymerase Wzy-like membrane protein/tetratricopeptide repeat protein